MYRCRVSFTLFLMISALPKLTLAQSQSRYQLTGSVLSADTHEPLAGATIRMLGTALGTTSNADGRYRLLLQPGNYRLRFGYIGFDSDTARVQITAADTDVSVYLDRSAVSLPEVVVYPSTLNPADEIIRRAIAAKQKWQPKLDSYDFNAYTKTVLRVDTSVGNSDPVIAGILETQTRGYWKSPDSYREVVTAKRQTANFSSSQNVFTAASVLNFYDDVVRIDRYSIPGPTSPSAFEHYNFSIIDTIRQGASPVFRIAVDPKPSASPLFKGIVDIAGGSYALLHTRLSLSDSTALDPLQKVEFDEQFAEYDDTYRLPIEMNMAFVVKFVVPPVPPILVENTSVLYHYSINPEFPAGFFDRDVVSAPPKNVTADSAVWNKQQILPLTGEEVKAYARLDSLVRSMPLYLKAVVFLTELPDRVATWPVTSLSDFYHYNRVEGSYLGVGLKSSTLLDRTTLTAIGGYGFSDRMWKYDFAATFRPAIADRMTIGASIFRRLTNRPEENIYSRFEVTLGALLYRDDYRDYFLSKGWSGSLQWRFSSYLNTGVQYNDEEQTSVVRNTNYSLAPQDYSFEDNPPIDDGRMRSIDLSLNVDTRPYSGVNMSMQSPEGTNYWVGNASVELSSPRYLNSSFSFERYHLSLLRHQMTFGSSFLKLWASAGMAGGRLPIQRMFEIQASYGGYAQAQVLSTLATRRILSDRTLVAGIEHDFPSSLFRWTGIPVIRNIWFDLTVFAHEATASHYKPMGEAGFGLVNIIPFIRTDFTWGVAGLCRGFSWTLATTLAY